MRGFFKDWTKFELSWLAIFTIINIYLSFTWGDNLLGFISALTGMLCVVLVAKGKISNYYFGIIQTGTYAYLSFTYGLYGEAMLNGLFYFPVQFIGIYLWSRNRTSKGTVGEEVSVKRMTPILWTYTAGIVIVATVLYGILLLNIGGRTVGLDSLTNVLSITAQIMMLKRFAEQWLIWILVNVLSIIMWIITLDSTGGGDYTIVIMWSAFLVNSVYGYFNWVRMSEGQLKTEVK